VIPLEAIVPRPPGQTRARAEQHFAADDIEIHRLPFLSRSQRSNSTATMRSSCTPTASSDASQTIGGPITTGSRNTWPWGAASGGSIPVTVAPPGNSRLTVTPVSRRSATVVRDSASLPAPHGRTACRGAFPRTAYVVSYGRPPLLACQAS
jgi:hypothetical protein